jgi:hypothetical protein
MVVAISYVLIEKIVVIYLNTETKTSARHVCVMQITAQGQFTATRT